MRRVSISADERISAKIFDVAAQYYLSFRHENFSHLLLLIEMIFAPRRRNTRITASPSAFLFSPLLGRHQLAKMLTHNA